jgi:peptidoglycan/xylan/chitin deacetylase (PgdA/CDA1 family)
MPNRIVKRVQTLMADSLHRKPAERPPGNAIVSFTFDDFPRSAWTVGGGVLAEYGMRGTYYASLALMTKRTPVGEMFEVQDLEALAAAGHELACHTHDHALCCDMSAGELLSNCEENQRRLAEVLPDYRLRTFSFPEGVVTPAAKALLNTRYDSCRTIESGINGNSVDLGFLRANAVYARSHFPKLKQLIRENARTKGWLILYTHDIGECPSAWGCTPQQFRDLVSWVVDSGAEVLAVGEATNRFISQSRAT